MRRFLRFGRSKDHGTQVLDDDVDQRILGEIALPDPPEEETSLAAVGTSALFHLEALEHRLTGDLRSESTESQRNDLNGYLESMVSAREEAKLLDLKLTESISSSSPHSSVYSLPESLESLLRLQSITERTLAVFKHNVDPWGQIRSLFVELHNWIVSLRKSDASTPQLRDDLNAVTLTDSEGTDWKPGQGKDQNTSPIEVAMRNAHPHLLSKQRHELNEFEQLVLHTESLPNIGSLQSVHLHRERGYLHHEYVLLCFAAPSIHESWIRVERAARFKRHRLQGDSFGPIIGGATLRETLSLAPRKEALTSGDEIASIKWSNLVSGSSASPDDSKNVYLKAAIRLIQLNSQASDKYRLLSENCRWFARRGTLSFLQRAKDMNAEILCVWKTRPVEGEVLEKELHGDWAGGRQLSSARSSQLNIYNLTLLARAALVDGNYTDTTTLCESVIRQLDAQAPPDDNQWYRGTKCYAHTLLADSLARVGRRREALDVQLKGVELARDTDASLYFEYIACEHLSIIYQELGDYDRALELQAALTKQARERYLKQGDDTNARLLARILFNVATTLTTQTASTSLPVPQSALVHITESVKMYRALHAKHPIPYHFPFADALHNQAIALNGVGFFREATSASREGIELLRIFLSESFADAQTQRDIVNPWFVPLETLPNWLYNHMGFASNAGLTDEAIQAGTEAVELLRSLHLSDVDAVYGTSLDQALFYPGLRKKDAGHQLKDYVPLWREALVLLRAQDASTPRRQEHLANVLYNIGAALNESAPSESLDLLAESVALTRNTLSYHPTNANRMELIIRLNEYAISAVAQSEWDLACKMEREQIEETRILESNGRGEHARDLAGALMNLARHLFQAGSHTEALETCKNAADEFKQLYLADSSTYRQPLTNALRGVLHCANTLAAAPYNDQSVVGATESYLRDMETVFLNGEGGADHQ